VSVTISSAGGTLTLSYDPVVLDEPSEFGVSRGATLGWFNEPVVTEFENVQTRTRLRLRLDPLTKAQAEILFTLLGTAGLVTITVMKQFPTTTSSPASYQGLWAEDGKSWIKPRLVGDGGGYPRNEHTTWDAIDSSLQIYWAEVELVVLRNDES
jgi:hypothetical protein